MGKTEVTADKGRKFNIKKHNEMAKRSVGQKIKCFSQEERNAEK
jgi:hypothetical protein